MNWINVNDSVPAESGRNIDYLVWDGSYFYLANYYAPDHMSLDELRQKYLWIEHNNSYYDYEYEIINPTHWLKLDKPKNDSPKLA